MKLSYLFSVSALLSAIRAQSTNLTELMTDTPKCALPCVLNGLAAFNCSLATLAPCLCTSIPFQANLSTCVQQSCEFQDQVRAVSVESGLCANYPKESRSSEVRRAAIITSAVAYPLVILRCISRWTITRQIWWDDWAVLGATFFAIALNVIELTSAGMGFGGHYWNVTVSDGTTLLKLFYVVQMLYILVQDLAKISILLLYFRVFPRPWFKMTTKILMTFMVSHGIAFIIVIIFQCSPISSIWDRTIQGKCVNLTAVGYTGAILSIVEDVVILVLPISELNTLSFGIRKRISLMLLFSVGSFACITSMVRLKYLVAFGNSYDSTWDNVDVVIWSIIEVYSALICACLPSLRPLLVQYLPSIFKSLTSKSNTGGDGNGYRMASWKPALRNNDSYGGLEDETLDKNLLGTANSNQIVVKSSVMVHTVDLDAEKGRNGRKRFEDVCSPKGSEKSGSLWVDSPRFEKALPSPPKYAGVVGISIDKR